MIDAIGAFRWRDALDILLIAIIVYRVLVMFKGTRAVQMVIGLAALVGASVLAQRLELHGLQFILDSLWSLWVIVLVVLFQPELRRALAWVGQGRAFSSVFGASRRERAQVVDEVASVAETLAIRRIGALIVLERATGLRQYAELGVPLDAIVSADLLSTIFLPYSPLHDGAVFIQSTRIVAAGCFLPLSRSMQVGRALGTRHRAALGISEETDAVAVAVSEETGVISVAVDGRLDAVADMQALRHRLHTLLGTGPAVAAPGAFLKTVMRLRPRRHEQA
ncbi:MAG: diadenylate cyclase CdaA [Candidatus Rokuibacteriota bacterium]